MNYVLKRIAMFVPLMLVISFFAFVLVRLAPGGPFDREREPASPEIEQRLRAKYHLDEPLWRQYARFLGDLAHGDFGASMKYRHHTVTDIIFQGLPVSATLGILAFGVAIGIGIPLGVVSAARSGTLIDSAGSLVALVAVCLPTFVIGPLLIMVFAIRWQWFPVALWETPRHAVLPSLTLGLYFAGKVARLTREGMLEVLQAEFVVVACAKGLSEAALLLKHAFRLAVLPVVSYAGPLLADLLTGSFVVENLFQVPGIGVFLVNSSLNRDYPMVVGLTLLYAAILLVLNLVVDLCYTLFDPRVRYE